MSVMVPINYVNQHGSTLPNLVLARGANLIHDLVPIQLQLRWLSDPSVASLCALQTVLFSSVPKRRTSFSVPDGVAISNLELRWLKLGGNPF